MMAQCVNPRFKVLVNGNEATARYYKPVGTASYSAALLSYGDSSNGWCAAKSLDGTYVCGASKMFDGNTGWCGLASRDDRGLGSPCPTGGRGGTNGFHGVNIDGIYDRCNNKQGGMDGNVETYMECPLAK